MIYMRKRAAIAMIELIFSIVIMGIVLMSAPMLISTATQSSYVALQQESIAAAASEIGMILTHHWDERDTDENLSAPILGTNGDAALNETVDADGNGTGLRAGTSRYSKRSFLVSLGGRLNSTAVANLGSDTGDRDDIDDFISANRAALDENESTTTSEGDYIDKDIVLTTTVGYISDGLPTGTSYTGTGFSIDFDIGTTAAHSAATTNIKKVVVILDTTKTEEEMQKSIRLNAFSCNIGTYELEERRY